MQSLIQLELLTSFKASQDFMRDYPEIVGNVYEKL